MTVAGWGFILAFIALLVALAKPMGHWLFCLYQGDSMPMASVIGPVERRFYSVAGINPAAEQSWLGYAVSVMALNIGGIVLLFAILKLQAALPFNPQGFPAVETLLAFNTAVSFVTNTNWQIMAAKRQCRSFLRWQA